MEPCSRTPSFASCSNSCRLMLPLPAWSRMKGSDFVKLQAAGNCSRRRTGCGGTAHAFCIVLLQDFENLLVCEPVLRRTKTVASICWLSMCINLLC